MKDKNLLKEINLDNLTAGPNQSVTVTVDAVDNELVSGSLQSAHTVDTITVDGVPLVDLAQINLDDIESQTVTIGKYADVLQGDLFNGWPEDGPPITITTLQEDDGYND